MLLVWPNPPILGGFVCILGTDHAHRMLKVLFDLSRSSSCVVTVAGFQEIVKKLGFDYKILITNPRVKKGNAGVTAALARLLLAAGGTAPHASHPSLTSPLRDQHPIAPRPRHADPKGASSPPGPTDLAATTGGNLRPFPRGVSAAQRGPQGL